MASRDRGRSPAQWYCLIAGAALLLAGIFGFFASAEFNTGNNLEGDSFLGFEVNGWHNIVHLLSGAFLLAMMGRRSSAKLAAIAFGLVYGVVTIWGLIDGNDVLGLLPINAADNVLHILLSLLGLGAGLASRGDDAPTVADRDRGAAPRSNVQRVSGDATRTRPSGGAGGTKVGGDGVDRDRLEDTGVERDRYTDKDVEKETERRTRR